MEIRDEIKSAVAKFLENGSTANKVYVRVRPEGSVDISEESKWCCSVAEYYKRTPHTLSLEILAATRDYSILSENEIEWCRDNRFEISQDLVDGWEADIAAWIEAGNLLEVAHA